MKAEEFWGQLTWQRFDQACAAIFAAIPRHRRGALMSDITALESLGKTALAEGARLYNATKEQVNKPSHITKEEQPGATANVLRCAACKCSFDVTGLAATPLCPTCQARPPGPTAA